MVETAPPDVDAPPRFGSAVALVLTLGVVSIALVFGVILGVRPAPKDWTTGAEAIRAAGFDPADLRVAEETLVYVTEAHTLPTLTDPELLSSSDAEALKIGRGSFLLPSDLVIGVEVDGHACAYPINLLAWHEAVDHTLGDTPLLVTYSPLTGTPAVYDRRLGDTTLRFGVSGLLYNSNTLLNDRAETASLWSQFTGTAISGPLAGASLTRVPSSFVHWSQWLERHPETVVVPPDLARGKLYKREPYSAYLGDDRLRFPVDPQPTGDLRPKARVIAVGDTVFPLSTILEHASDGLWETELDGQPLQFVVHHPTHPGGHLSVDLFPLPKAPVRHAYWFAWCAQ